MSKRVNPKFTVLFITAALICILAISFLTTLFTERPGHVSTELGDQPETSQSVHPQKILYVDSYHEGYPWSDGITKGVRAILQSRDSIELRIERMDTKRNVSEDFKKAAGLKIKQIIDDWNPNIVIASDDNASKYLIAPFYINEKLPFVFCGVNGDISTYGFPAENITGMIEVAMIPQLIETLKEYSRGERVGYLAPDTYTDRLAYKNHSKGSGIDFSEVVFTKTYDDWKREFIRLQSKVDLLVITNYIGITGFDFADAHRFTRLQTSIPTGSIMELMSPLALITQGKVAEEQGEWAATRALQILDGIRPADIAVTYNKKAQIHLNYELAGKLALTFKNELVDMSYIMLAKQNYSGDEITRKSYDSNTTLNILTHEIPIMGEPTLVHAAQFEELTGIKVNVHHAPFNRLFQETVQGLKTSKYDIVFYGSMWIADLHDFLEPVPESLLRAQQFTDILPHYRSLAKWEETTYQVNIDGDRHYLQYRKDLLENPSFQQEFQDKYGKPLAVPKTWKELNEVAGFFHGRTLANGKTIYGMAEITDKDDLLFSQFLKRAASYAKHPDVREGFYFDLKTMKPLINTPGFVEALEDFVEMQKYYPPGGNAFGLSDVTISFGNGDVVFSDCWDDSFIQAMQKNSAINDKVAASLSPGSRKVWNRNTRAWDYYSSVNHVPYFAWGWTSGVSKSSENKEAAFDYLGFFANNENHSNDLLVGRFGLNPYREMDLNPAFWVQKAGWPPSVAESYVGTLKKMANSSTWLMDLRIYQNRQYMNALAIGVYRALTKRDTAQKALNEVARRWEQITDSVGRDKQREAYSHIVKFENQKVNMESAE